MAHVTIDLVARKDFEHDGRQVAVGECFSCRPIVAAALVYQHKAEFAAKAQRQIAPGSRHYRRRDMEAER